MMTVENMCRDGVTFLFPRFDFSTPLVFWITSYTRSSFDVIDRVSGFFVISLGFTRNLFFYQCMVKVVANVMYNRY